MTIIVSMAGSPGPLERTGRARKMSEVKTAEVTRRPRGRPRKNPEGIPGEISKKRGSQKSHGAEHYAEIRYKRELAGIIHKQFRILVEDEEEAERLLSKLMKKANAAYHRVSESLSTTEAGKAEADLPEPDPLDDPVPESMPVSQEPPTASLPEIEAAPVQEPPERPKSIKERGKLSLKAFRKDAVS